MGVIEKWQDRIENELALQKELCLETVRLTLTRRELVELRMILGLAKEQKDIRTKEGSNT